MVIYEDIDELPEVPEETLGLADRSVELETNADKDVRIRFYQAMASTDIESGDFVVRLCTAVATLFCDMCAIFLVDETHDLRLVAAHDVNESLNELLDQIDLASILPHDLRLVPVGPDHRPQVLTRDGHRFVGLPNGATSAQVQAHSALIVPLHTMLGEPFGAMFIARHATSQRFTETDIAKVQWVASDIAMRIEAGRLHRHLRTKNAALEAQAAQLAEAVRDRDDFIGAAAHELKTPLSTLALQVALIERVLDADESGMAMRLRGNVDAIGRQVGRLTRLVDQLLDTTQLSNGELDLHYERVDLRMLADEVVRRFRPHAEEARVRLRVVGGPVQTFTDADRLDQVMSGLLSNAIKYTRDGEVVLGIEACSQLVTITVSDNGIGVPEDAREAIFERFARGQNAQHRSGLGLGLWITRRIVERMDGTIRLRESSGPGSTFEVRLPRHQTRVEDIPSSARQTANLPMPGAGQ